MVYLLPQSVYTTCEACGQQSAELVKKDKSYLYFTCGKCGSEFKFITKVKELNSVQNKLGFENNPFSNDLQLQGLCRNILAGTDEYCKTDEMIRSRMEIVLGFSIQKIYRTRFIDNLVYIESISGSWCFDYTGNEIKLIYMNHLKKERKLQQKSNFQRTFPTACDVMFYIHAHDTYCYTSGAEINPFLVELRS